MVKELLSPAGRQARNTNNHSDRTVMVLGTTSPNGWSRCQVAKSVTIVTLLKTPVVLMYIIRSISHYMIRVVWDLSLCTLHRQTRLALTIVSG
jgi:hypothetical protein